MPNQEQITGIVRHILTAAGGVLVTLGLADEATAQAAFRAAFETNP